MKDDDKLLICLNFTYIMASPTIRIKEGKIRLSVLIYEGDFCCRLYLTGSNRRVYLKCSLNLLIYEFMNKPPEKIQLRGSDMSLVKIKRFSQVTLPPDVRKKFNLNEGDYLEAEAVEDGILLKPVAVVERKRAWNRLFDVLDTVEERKPKRRKNAQQEEEEITEMVKDFRKQSHG